MNTLPSEHQLEASIQTRLMVIVERAVRPLEACVSRRQRMREELLAHVTAVYEEELSALNDADRALERTRERFGDPAALAAQLQQSVPRFERWGRRFERAFIARKYTPFQFAWRCSALSLLFPGLALLAVFLIKGRLAEWPMIPTVAALVFGFVMMFYVVFEALFGPRGRSWGRIALVAIAAWAFVPAIMSLLTLALSRDWRIAAEELPGQLAFALMTPVALLITAWAFAEEARVQRPWTSLVID